MSDEATSDRVLPVQSFILETNTGGVGVTVCACGVVLLRSFLAWNHINACPFMPREEGKQ